MPKRSFEDLANRLTTWAEKLANRLTIWAEKHGRPPFHLLLLAVVGVALWVRLRHFGDVGSRSPDERVYAHFAQQLATDGLEGYRRAFESYATDPGQWQYPSPTRLTHVLSFAAIMKLTGSSTPQAGAAVSLLLSLASVGWLAVLARRHFNPFVATLAALFLAAQLGDVEFSRRAWGESMAAFMSLALVSAACAFEKNPSGFRPLLGLVTAGMGCLLTKETSVLTFVLCGAWLLARRLLAKDHVSAIRLVLGGVLSAAAALGLLWLLAGNLTHAFDGLRRGMSLGSSEWGVRNASGPWYQFPLLLALVGPLTAVMTVVGGVAIALRRRVRSFEGYAPTAPGLAGLSLWLVLAYVAACSFGPNLQYLRVMAPANASYCLLAAVGVHSLLVEGRARLRRVAYLVLMAALPLALAAASARDQAFYEDVVVGSGMQDMPARWLFDGAERRKERSLDRAAQALEAAPRPAPAELIGAQPSAQGDLNRSLEHCRQQRYAACVNAAQAALRKNPQLAEAWNNAAAGYSGLELWDDAIRHAAQAIQLRPDFQLAKNNLAWATQQKARQPSAP